MELELRTGVSLLSLQTLYRRAALLTWISLILAVIGTALSLVSSCWMWFKIKPERFEQQAVLFQRSNVPELIKQQKSATALGIIGTSLLLLSTVIALLGASS